EHPFRGGLFDYVAGFKIQYAGFGNILVAIKRVANRKHIRRRSLSNSGDNTLVIGRLIILTTTDDGSVQQVNEILLQHYDVLFHLYTSVILSSCPLAPLRLQAVGGLGHAPRICVWISKRYASKTVCQQVRGRPLPFQSVRISPFSAACKTPSN